MPLQSCEVKTPAREAYNAPAATGKTEESVVTRTNDDQRPPLVSLPRKRGALHSLGMVPGGTKPRNFELESRLSDLAGNGDDVAARGFFVGTAVVVNFFTRQSDIARN